MFGVYFNFLMAIYMLLICIVRIKFNFDTAIVTKLLILYI